LIHVGQAGELLRRQALLFFWFGEMVLKSGKSLFELHHPLGESMNGLGQIFRVPGDAEGNR
jgi:hypothetical protein